MSRVCCVTTTPSIVNACLGPHLLAFASRHEVTVATNSSDGYRLDRALRERLRVEHVPIARSLAPLSDVQALAVLRQLLCGPVSASSIRWRRKRLLGMLVWATRRGALRRLLRAADRIAAAHAAHVLVVSRGEQAFLARA